MATKAAPKKKAAPAKKKVFLSGPMGSMAEIEGQMALRKVLEPAYHVYLAPTDGVEMRSLIELIADPAAFSKQFLQAALLVQQIGWAQEMYQLLSCDALVLNMDGRVPDEGAVVEATTAYMSGKPVVIFKDTAVTFWDFFNNPMVAALDGSWQVVSQRTKLSAAVRSALANPPSPKGYDYVPPQNIKDAYEFGEFVFRNRAKLMAALKRAAGNLQGALTDLEPDMANMQTFAEALIGGSSPRKAAVRAWG